MIRFACPRCNTVLEVPDFQGGAKVACAKCRQRLQVPTLPPINKTVLAPLVGRAPDPGTPQSKPAACKVDSDWRSSPPPVLSGNDLVPHVDVEPVNAPVASIAPLRKSLLRRLRSWWPGRRFWMGATPFLIALALVSLVILFALTGQYAQQTADIQKAEIWNPSSEHPPRPRAIVEEEEPRHQAPQMPEQQPPALKPPTKKGDLLTSKERRELSQWLKRFQEDTRQSVSNPIRHRDVLEKAEEKALAYTREFTARKVRIGFYARIHQIDEDGVYLISSSVANGVVIDAL